MTLRRTIFSASGITTCGCAGAGADFEAGGEALEGDCDKEQWTHAIQERQAGVIASGDNLLSR